MGVVCCAGKAPDEYDPDRHAAAVLHIEAGKTGQLWPSPPLDPSCLDSNARNGKIVAREPRLGFQLLPELDALLIDDAFAAPYSLPREVLAFEPRSCDVVTTLADKSIERKLHCNVELSDEEQEQLRMLEFESRARNLCFFPSVAVDASRYLEYTSGDLGKALALMQSTQAWREEYFGPGPIVAKVMLDEMSHGMIYVVGRDSGLQPTIVFRAGRVPPAWFKERFIFLLRVLIFTMEYVSTYMCLPGRVENISLIVDARGLGLHNTPMMALREIFRVFSNYYPCRISSLYICHLTPGLGMLIPFVRSVLTPRQKQNFHVVRDLSELMKHWAPHQLEEDLGGSRASITSFFPFPIQPGPFALGCQGGPDFDATCLHKAFVPGGLRGQLWDSSLPRQRNLQLGYSVSASELFTSCGLPDPCSEPPAYIAKAYSISSRRKTGKYMPSDVLSYLGKWCQCCCFLDSQKHGR